MGGVQVGKGGEGRSVQSMGEIWKDFCPQFLQPFLQILTKGAVTTEARSLFQYFTILTENADPLLRRWLAPWSTLKGCPLRPRRGKISSDEYPKGP